MMKSLERVIGTGTATTGESSPRSTCSETATPVGERLAESGAPVDQTPFDLELLWRGFSSYEDDSNSPSPDGAATPCGQIQEVDPYIRRIVEASDYELGLTDVSDLDGSLHGSWNYVSDNSPCSSSSPATSYWFDAPFQQFEEAIETYDPVLF
ncbi:hypothetical protein KP509_05G004300 [Ceratopteris richardii]|nr:hypothetical protein KP509_05G004300 [Ceratopteris richardii]